MMTDELGPMYCGAIISGIFVLLIMLTAWDIDSQKIKKETQELKIEAVKRGFATWKTDEQGNVTFTWNDKQLKPMTFVPTNKKVKYSF